SLGRRLEQRLAPLLEDADLSAWPTLDPHGVLLRAPACEAETTSAPPSRRPAGAPPPSALEARELLDRLTQRRAGAARHAARPRLRAVSETSRIAPPLPGSGGPAAGGGDEAAMARGR